jgi:CubicO group peptidase (beta-lactamase class C family)
MRTNNIIFLLAYLIMGFNVIGQSFQDSPVNENDGDFPAKWDLIEGSAQIGTLEGSKVILLSNKSTVTPIMDTKNYLPDTFTLEFEAYFDVVRGSVTFQYYTIGFWDGTGHVSFLSNGSRASYNPIKVLRHGAEITGTDDGKYINHTVYKKNMETKPGVWRRVKLDYKKGALKVNIDGTQILNIPRYTYKPKMITIGVFAQEYNENYVHAIKNIRLEGNEDALNEEQDQTNPSSFGEGGLVTVLPSDSSVNSGSPFNTDIIDDIVYEEMIRQNLPGMAVGVYKKGVVDYTKGYGFLDIDRTMPITDNTILRWASISKTITAVATFQLEVKKGNFTINDKVVTHYPHWTSKFNNKEVSDKINKNNITIRNLLNNRSGINHYTRDLNKTPGKFPNSGSTYDSNNSFNANSAVDIFRTANLVFKPDSTYMYSTNGFTLLGAVIDENYFDGYPNFVKKNIKDKLDMSGFRVSRNPKYRGFKKKFDGIIEEQPIGSKEFVLPGGGWESNVKALLNFAKGIVNGELLKNTSDLWQSDGNESDPNDEDYKRGVYSRGSGENLEVWHGGNHDNLTTLLYTMPNNDIAVVLMIPIKAADRNNINQRIVNELGYSMSFSTDPRDKCTKGTNSSSKNFVGLWRESTDDVIIRRGLSTANFNKEWKFLGSNGYYLEDLESFTNDSGDLLWEGIFKKGNGKYAMWRNFDFTGFKNKWDEMRQMGYILFDLETYLINGEQRWAGLFKKQSGANGLWRNLTTTGFADKRDEMTQQGKKLIDIEVHTSEGELKWSGVWIEGSGELLNRNYDYREFTKLIIERRKKGYKLMDIETYEVNGARKWAGIWDRSSKQQRHHLTYYYCGIMNKHTNYSDEGFELIDLQHY